MSSDRGVSDETGPGARGAVQARNAQSAHLPPIVNLGMLNRNDNKGQVMASAASPKGLFSGGLHAAVSKKKRRFNDGQHDLDLAYITDRVIAMGFPSSGFESTYRNSMEDTLSFFNDRHPKRFMIVNLCSEREYDHKNFTDVGGLVIRFPFDDHNCPMFDNIPLALDKIDSFLRKDAQNVVAFHCKAGKGRTGLAICIYLLRNKWVGSAQESRQYYAMARTHNQKGVTIPSQIRYVHYYEQYMRLQEQNQQLPRNRTFKIRRIFVERSCPSWEKIVLRTHTQTKEFPFQTNEDHKYGEDDLTKTKMMHRFGPETCPKEIMVSQTKGKSRKRSQSFGGSSNLRPPLGMVQSASAQDSTPDMFSIVDLTSQMSQSWQVTLGGDDLVLHKDVKILFKHKPLVGKASTAFGMWFNTDFIQRSTSTELVSEKDCLYRLTLTRLQLDKVGKMKSCDDFRVEVLFDLVEGSAPSRPGARPAGDDMDEKDEYLDNDAVASRQGAVPPEPPQEPAVPPNVIVLEPQERGVSNQGSASTQELEAKEPAESPTLHLDSPAERARSHTGVSVGVVQKRSAARTIVVRMMSDGPSASSATTVTRELDSTFTPDAVKFLEHRLAKEYTGSTFTVTDAVTIVTGLRTPDATYPMSQPEAVQACQQLVREGAILPASNDRGEGHTDTFELLSSELWEMRTS